MDIGNARKEAEEKGRRGLRRVSYRDGIEELKDIGSLEHLKLPYKAIYFVQRGKQRANVLNNSHKCGKIRKTQ
jgi:hypothetical protein